MHIDGALLKEGTTVIVPDGATSVISSPEVAVPDRPDVSVVSSPADDYCSEESDVSDEDIDFVYGSSSDEDVPLRRRICQNASCDWPSTRTRRCIRIPERYRQT